MPLIKTARTLFIAASAFLFAHQGLAAETEPSPDVAAVAVAPTQSLFSSWFSGSSAVVDGVNAAMVDTETPGLATTRSMLSMGIPPTGSLVVGALGLLGISYRMGGNTPASGFDCSGMVRYVFQNALGLDLPRRAEEISRVGTRVDRAELKPGDLVFYKTLRKTFSHVGIYLGNNRFIHAPSAGGSVRVDDMSESYWAARFNGARRVGP